MQIVFKTLIRRSDDVPNSILLERNSFRCRYANLILIGIANSIADIKQYVC